LLTFGDGDGRWRAGYGGAARAKLGADESGLRCFSDDGNTFCDGGEAHGSTYRGQLDTGGSGAAERRRDLQLRAAAQVDGKSTGGALFIGDLLQCVAEADSTQSQLKTIQTLRDWR
jgi:hypothetical protein